MKKNGFAALAAAYSLMGIFLFAILNFSFGRQTPWCIYPIYGALWAPIAIFFCGRRNFKGFAIAGSAMTFVFLAAVNLLYSPDRLWFLYTLYPLLWWPLSFFFDKPGRAKTLSVVGGLLTIAYLMLVNWISSPEYPWFWYACYPVLWWPISVLLGRRAGTVGFAALCTLATTAYYAALNWLLAPGFPWVLFVALPMLWWPASMVFARRRAWLGLAVFGSVWTIAFFAATNAITSPGVLWAFYPVFAVLWWPLAVLCARRRAWMGFAAAGSALTILFFLAVNWATSPGVPWMVYPAFAVLWWPLSVYFFRYRKQRANG